MFISFYFLKSRDSCLQKIISRKSPAGFSQVGTIIDQKTGHVFRALAPDCLKGALINQLCPFKAFNKGGTNSALKGGTNCALKFLNGSVLDQITGQVVKLVVEMNISNCAPYQYHPD